MRHSRLELLVTKSADGILNWFSFLFFIIYPENRTGHFLQIVPDGENLLEISNHFVFLKKKKLDWTFLAHYLRWRKFAWSVKFCFHDKNKKNVINLLSAEYPREWYENVAKKQKVKTRLPLIFRYITKTRLYNFDPLRPHFYIIKLGFTGVYFIFLISAQKHRLRVLVRTASPRGY